MNDDNRDFIPKGAIEVGPVEYWASLGDIDLVKSAIADGNDVNAKSENGNTAIHAAALNGYKDIVELLIQHGGVSNAKLDSGQTPADLARDGGHDEIVLLLQSEQ